MKILGLVDFIFISQNLVFILR